MAKTKVKRRKTQTIVMVRMSREDLNTLGGIGLDIAHCLNSTTYKALIAILNDVACAPLFARMLASEPIASHNQANCGLPIEESLKTN